MKKAITFQTYFSAIEAPRQQNKIKHELIDILVLSIIAIICGANEYIYLGLYSIKNPLAFLK